MELKPFNLEAALQGAEIITESGLEVTEIYKFKTTRDAKVFAVINGEVVKVSNDVYFNGRSWSHLYMKPQQVTKWVNIYNSSDYSYISGNLLFDTKEQAEECRGNIVDTVQITFEV